MALDIVVVVPEAMLNVGSPETVIALAMVVVPVTLREAGVVGLPTSARVPPPSAAEDDICKLAPLATVTPPLKVFIPVRICVPPLINSEPVPPMAPEKAPEADVSVRDLAPRATVPAPVSALIEAPEVVAEISRVPPFATPDELATAPAPDRDRVAPEAMVVAPV